MQRNPVIYLNFSNTTTQLSRLFPPKQYQRGLQALVNVVGDNKEKRRASKCCDV